MNRSTARIRVAGAALCLVVGLGSAVLAWAAVFRANQPQLALAIAPWDAQAQATLASQILVTEPSPTGFARARVLALKSLARQPVQPVALRTIAYVDTDKSDGNISLAMIEQSQRLSRRDLLTQLWLIERFSNSDDIDRVLRHYEIALSGAEAAPAILFPRLVGVADDPSFNAPLSRFLARNLTRGWRSALLGEMIVSGRDVGNVARIVTPHLDPGNAEDRTRFRELIGRLADDDKLDQAFGVYTLATRERPDAAGQIRDGSFRNVDRYPPIDWQPGSPEQSQVFAVDLDGPRAGRGLALEGNAGSAATLLRHSLRLGVGRYSLSFLATGSDLDNFSVSASCLRKGRERELGRTAFNPRSVRQSLSFVTTPDCDWYSIDWLFDAGRRSEPLNATLSDVRLAHAIPTGEPGATGGKR